MGRKANEKMSLFAKCHCGSRGHFVINSGAENVCQIHYDELIKIGKVIPPSHYITQDGHKVISVPNGKKIAGFAITDHLGNKIDLTDVEYRLVKV